ncbi:MAG: hypothetical protein O2931_05510 [Planctomycetota bacterium]|nr:hypothetical protein [Planctomycetota bacterium]MDA1178239.1 hypothetical protein [Planctomycetota bacterium]
MTWASPGTSLPTMATPKLRLSNNLRASLLGLVVPGFAVMLGGLLTWGASAMAARGSSLSGWLGAFAGLVVAGGLCMTWAVVYWSFLPRLSYENKCLLLQLRLGRPERIPIEVVECFFIGQGPGEGNFGGRSRPEAVNLVVRLAESAKEWHKGNVRPALGSWCDGYIVLRGMWCEPLDGDRVAELNHSLIQIKRSLGLRA